MDKMKNYEGITECNGEIIKVHTKAENLNDAWEKLTPPTDSNIILLDVVEV